MAMTSFEGGGRWRDVVILVVLAYLTYSFAAPRLLPPSFSLFFPHNLARSWQKEDGIRNITQQQVDNNNNNSAPLPPSYVSGGNVRNVSAESPLVHLPSNGSIPPLNQSFLPLNQSFLPSNCTFNLPSNGSDVPSSCESFLPPSPSCPRSNGSVLSPNRSFLPPNESFNGGSDVVSPTPMPPASPLAVSEYYSNASISVDSNHDKEPQKNNTSAPILPPLLSPPPPPPAEPHAQCLSFDGEWVQDDAYPLYPPSSCPFVEEEFACFENGRPDFNYTRFRWIPRGCEDLRFNATDLLERFRGKRIAFVGDSLGRNQFESMLCMLHHSIPNKDRVYKMDQSQIGKGIRFAVIMFQDYNFRLEFYQSHYMVSEGIMPKITSQKYTSTIRLDTINELAPQYKNADVIVFNTGHWWTHARTKKGSNFYQEGNYLYPKLTVREALRKALMTWAQWVKENIDTSTTQVFFRTHSPSHFRGGQWNSGGRCHMQTLPIYNPSFLLPYPDKMKMVEGIIWRMKIRVKLLNVTRLSDFRKDAHPSIYGHKFQRPGQRQDCSHWCLPGLPDAWNELLYGHLVRPDLYI